MSIKSVQATKQKLEEKDIEQEGKKTQNNKTTRRTTKRNPTHIGSLPICKIRLLIPLVLGLQSL